MGRILTGGLGGRRQRSALLAVVLAFLLVYLALGSSAMAEDPNAKANCPTTGYLYDIKGWTTLENCAGLTRSKVITLQVKLYKWTGTTSVVCSPVYKATSVNTLADGSFLIPNVVPGKYTLWVKGSHTLAVCKTFTVSTAGTTQVSIGTLPEGDVNGDNTIDSVDAGLLMQYYGKTSWRSGVHPDLNGDGKVDCCDVQLLSANYAKTTGCTTCQ
jgi:hypothetical protein